MGIEVEVKVRAPEALGSIMNLAKRIDDTVQSVFELESEPTLMTTKDWYYYPPNDGPAARFREEFVTGITDDSQKKRIFFTMKEKTLIDGVEVNSETEQEISESQRVILVADYVRRGYVDIGYVKIKAGVYYPFRNNVSIRVETVWAALPSRNTAHVGNFYEVEKLLPADASAEDKAEAQKTVTRILALLGFSESDIESRSWKVLCSEAIANKEKQ